MKHFRLKLILLAFGIIASSASAAFLFTEKAYSFAILVCLLLVCLIIGLAISVRKLIHIMQSFVTGLEMSDNSMRYDFGKDDPELREMAEAMNRIASTYKSNSQELETRKIYYDRILKVMTHEMRNAITPIISLTTDMQHKPGKYHDEYLSETVSVIKDQSLEIKRFLDSYHELTHLPSPQKELTKATDFIAGVRTGISGIVSGLDINEIVQFVVSPTATLFIDRGMMLQVMRNMIKNALESVAKTENPKIIVTTTMSGDSVLITIEDNGPGISPYVMQNLYQPFITSKPHGTGIGLFISRQIVRLHGGELLIRNHPDKGVTVQISVNRDCPDSNK